MSDQGLPPLATVDDLTARLGQRIDAPEQAMALLRYASALVRAHCRQTWADDAGELVDVPDGIRSTTVEIVYRACTNPDGITQDSAGAFSVSFGSDAAQRLYLTRSDRRILDAHTSGGPSGLGILSTTRGPVETRRVDGGHGLGAGLDFPGWQT